MEIDLDKIDETVLGLLWLTKASAERRPTCALWSGSSIKRAYKYLGDRS
jgi:hypothetical protein